MGLFLVFAILQLLSFGEAVCPHDQTGLSRWSSQGNAWNSASSSVTIPAGTRYLFDIGSCSVQSIIVNGDLIFADQDASLTTAHILINPTGRLFIGSDEDGCAIKSKITITFVGDRTTISTMGEDPIDRQPLGSKGIAATTNSTISIVGNVPAFTWTRIATTAQKGSSTITVKDNVGWSVGDTIVIASTDFHATTPWSQETKDWPYFYLGRGNADQNEMKTIKSISGTTITLDSPLQYSHWGSGYEFAEVGLINRNIILTGDSTTSTTSFGGQIMIRKCTVAKLKGFEITKFGQKGILGRYPLHFHHAEEVWGRGFYADSISVHDCFQRCMVIHDTHGVTLSNNVAWNNNGHCYFLEDASERGNTINYNLGIRAIPIRKSDPNILIPTDEQAAMFWITNPNNTFIGNAAVESVFGFWFSLPPSPTGIAAARYGPNDPLVRPRLSPLGAFKNNVAHGSLKNGLHIDDMEIGVGPNPLETDLASWTPRTAPYDSSNSQQLTVTLESMICYKNREYGTWARGGPFIFTDFVHLDNMRGFNAPPEPSVLINSLIVGETDNIGTPLPAEMGRSRPGRFDINDLIKGWETYDNGGNQHVESTVFVNFTSDSVRNAGAISPLECGPFLLQSRDRSRNITLINANPVYISDCNQGGDCTHSWPFLDTDGTLTGNGPSWVVSKNNVLADSSCTFKPEWNGYSCPFFAEGGYIQLTLTLFNLAELNKDNTYKYLFDPQKGTYYDPSTSNTTRASFTEFGTTNTYNGLGNNMNGGDGPIWWLQANLKARRGYAVRFPTTPTPPNMYMQINAALPNDWIVINMVYPKSSLPIKLTLIQQWYNTQEDMTRVNSLSDLNDIKEYFYDDATENLYFYITNRDKGYTQNFGYTNQYGNDGYTIKIEAQGTPSVPSAASQKIPAAVVPPSKFDIFQADLQSCQVTPQIYANRRGSAFFILDSDTGYLNYRVAHDLGTNVKSVTINQGAVGTNGPVVATFEWKDSPINYFTSLSRRLWIQLLLGNLYVSVVDNSGNEQSRGQIRCVGVCSLPSVGPTQDRCSTANIGSDPLTLYSDGSLGDSLGVHPLLITNKESKINTTQNTDTTTFACGDSSIHTTAYNGAFGLLIYPTKKVAQDAYQYFQFYIKLAPGTSLKQLRIIIDSDAGTINTGDAAQLIPASYIDNAAFDTEWARVRIPLSFLKFNRDVNVNAMYFWGGDWGQTPYEFWIDEIKFIKNDAVDTIGTPVSQSQVATYSTICTPTPSPTGGLGQGSGVVTGGQLSSATVAQMCFALIAFAFFLL